MECSRPEYCSGYPFPSPGALPNPGTEPRFLPLQADSLPAEPPGKPSCVVKAGSNGYYVAWRRWAVSVSVPPLTKKEDPLKKVVATHSSTLLWEIPWTGAGQASESAEFSRQDYWNFVSTTETKWVAISSSRGSKKVTAPVN